MDRERERKFIATRSVPFSVSVVNCARIFTSVVK